MYLQNFKTSKKVELSKAIKTYVSKHYDMNAFNAIESLTNDLEYFRNAAVTVGDLEKSPDSLKKNKDNNSRLFKTLRGCEI